MSDPVRPDRAVNQVARTGAMPWRMLDEPGVSGISVKVLRYDPARKRAPTILLKFEAGSSYPAHNHPGGEEVFVLEGDIRFGKDLLRAGDYLYTPPGGKHAASSEGGCVLLVNIPQEVEILKNSLE